MNALEILADLRRAGALVTIAGDKLRLEAPKGVLTDELKQRLATQKAEIIRLLQAEAALSGYGRPRCYHCSKFGPIGAEAGCSNPGDPTVSMAGLVECPDFAARTVH
jgi:hypothetical protein